MTAIIVYESAVNLRIDAMNWLMDHKICGFGMVGRLLGDLVGPDYSANSWTDAELNIYRALLGPHGNTIFRALVVKHGVNLDLYK